MISENKTRRSYTLDKEILKYLEERSREESEKTRKKITVSNIIEQLAESDREIRSAFK